VPVRARRLIVKRGVPAAELHAGLRKQGGLNVRRQFQILFQRSLLRSGEVIQAQADERVRRETAAFDRLVAFLA
jgi:hypothetical protein